MKSSITSLVASGLVSCALAIGAATPSFAQSGALAKADIPFAFQVGNKILPAGTYLFSRDGANIMILRGTEKDTQIASMVLPDTGLNAPKVGRVTFTKYGDRYFLHKVSTAGSSTSYHWTTGVQEKKLIHELRKQPPTEVAVNVMPNLH